jgi:hypothetical protein
MISPMTLKTEESPARADVIYHRALPVFITLMSPPMVMLSQAMFRFESRPGVLKVT